MGRIHPNILKLKRQRRAWARPFTVKGGRQLNREVLQQYQRTAKGLGLEIAQVRFPSVAPGRKEMMERASQVGDALHTIIHDIRDPFFTQIVSTPTQRCLVFWNSRMDTFILQWIQWRRKVYHISIAYPTFAIAHQRWLDDKVRWRIRDKPFPTSAG